MHALRDNKVRVGIAFLLVIWSLAPIYWLFVSAISPSSELSAYPPHWFPENPTSDRLGAVLSNEQVSSGAAQSMQAPGVFFRSAMLNSIIVALATTVLCVSIGTVTGYAFARIRFPGRGLLMLVPLMFQMVPPIALVIPLFMIVQALGLIDTIWALILVYPSFLLIYVVWVMSGFFASIPRELEEAGIIDGANRWQVFTKIVLPLSKPAIFSTSLLTFLFAWDEFLFALILTTREAKTLPVAVGEFSSQFGIDFGMMMAGGLLASLPPILLAIVLQPLLVQGLAAGAVKG